MRSQFPAVDQPHTQNLPADAEDRRHHRRLSRRQCTLSGIQAGGGRNQNAGISFSSRGISQHGRNADSTVTTASGFPCPSAELAQHSAGTLYPLRNTLSQYRQDRSASGLHVAGSTARYGRHRRDSDQQQGTRYRDGKNGSPHSERRKTCRYPDPDHKTASSFRLELSGAMGYSRRAASARHRVSQ